jgi:hypothetical protein
VGLTAAGERELARADRYQLAVEVERELALDHVERLIEVVRVQRRTAAPDGMTLSIRPTRPPLSSLRTRTLG